MTERGDTQRQRQQNIATVPLTVNGLRRNAVPHDRAGPRPDVGRRREDCTLTEDLEREEIEAERAPRHEPAEAVLEVRVEEETRSRRAGVDHGSHTFSTL